MISVLISRILVAFLLVLSGCSALARRDAVPVALQEEEFDTEYMRALFKVGFDMAAKGYPWEKVPPDYADHHLR